MALNFEIPKWASKPPPGVHLDVMKGDKLVQKLMLDEKKCYLFGRNPQMNDFCIDHASCSRVHAALVYHKHLERAFLVDLGSTHGTFIGSLRLESQKPTQLPIDSSFHFGASTRIYIIRERPPTVVPRPIMEELEKTAADSEGALLGLPETDTELDNLTEFNTAHNRRISMLGIPDDEKRKNPKKKRKNVSFNEEEEIINPEDIDPSVGRFRNLVQTTIIPSSKRPKLDSGLVPSNHTVKHYVPKLAGLYDDLPDSSASAVTTPFFTSLSSKLGLPLPNPAPEVEVAVEEPRIIIHPHNPPLPPIDPSDEPRKKKYAKEAWPGKKHGPSNLLV
ncbi:unnamed protein product [Orchesella dallaii]|uniref:FHA domain-containing protein n=1 Tax=Orchesella dallaii TaxID=48710 RepID=A0ABP1QZZ0_9HEXA